MSRSKNPPERPRAIVQRHPLAAPSKSQRLWLGLCGVLLTAWLVFLVAMARLG